MIKILFSIIVSALIVTANFAPVAAQKKSAPEKTRDVKIYIYGDFDADNGMYKIVPVPRKIVDYRPLDATLKLLLEGTTEEERERGLSDLHALDLKFYSARVRNRTAEINLKLKREENIEESWEGAGFRYDKFVEAVELTARQFVGIERVSICINGIANYADFTRTNNKKCAFPMFAPVKMPKQPR